jgi:hypothetical protein
MERWSELKEAFWAVVDLEPADRARQLSSLASSDPELHRHLEAWLAADARSESPLQIFDAAATTMPDRPAQIGPYAVAGVRGVGGMGYVYRAYDSRLQREVAIKVLPAEVASNHVAPSDNPRNARPLLDSAFVETHGRFAPAGNWFLYTSRETGRYEVYVDRFPDRGARRLVSNNGGSWARWARDGSEIFYLAPDNQLMSAAVTATSGRLIVNTPRPLFTLRPRPPVRLDAYPYDVSPDGTRFVVNTLIDGNAPTSITLVVNWMAELTRD